MLPSGSMRPASHAAAAPFDGVENESEQAGGPSPRCA